MYTFPEIISKLLECRKAIKLLSEEEANKNRVNIIPLGSKLLFAKVSDLVTSLSWSFLGMRNTNGREKMSK